MTVKIGTWSVPGPRSRGHVLQLVRVFDTLSEQKTLSTCVQFPVDIDCRVSSLRGSAIIMW